MVCRVGTLKNVLCTTSKTSYKNSQELVDYEPSAGKQLQGTLKILP
jgi:hypothetical protein